MMRRDLLPKEHYFMDSIFTTRGCPNHCRFCPVTDIFGPKIRHRPIDEVVAEVNTLRDYYFNVDDSVFGHPQIADRPQEDQYYLDLYRELAQLRPRRSWTGAGGLSAVNYRNSWSWRQRAASATSPPGWNRSRPRARSSRVPGASFTSDHPMPSI